MHKTLGVVILRIIAATIFFLFWTPPVNAQVTVAADVTEDALSANSQPKLVRDAHGAIYVTFVKGAGGVSQIFVARSADGRRWTIQQVTREAGDSRFPTLALGSDGRVHLAWTQYTEPAGKVYYASFDGRRWSRPINLSLGLQYAGVPAVGVDLQQQPHVVWYGIRRDAPSVRTPHGSIYEILYRGFSRNRWSEPAVISPGIPDSINPALAVDGSGVLHSAWYQFDLRRYQVQYTQRTRAWGDPTQISFGGEDSAAVALAAGADGSAYAVWERRGPTNRIYFAERRARWRGQEVISPSGQHATDPTVTVDTSNRVYVAWASNGTIYLRRRDGQWRGVERLTRDGRHSSPVLSTRGPAVDLVWVEDRGSERVLRFTSLTGTQRASPIATDRTPWVAALLASFAAILLWQYLRYKRRAALASRRIPPQ